MSASVPSPGQGEFKSDTFTLPDNPSETQRMSRGRFVEVLTLRFGHDPMGWCLACPQCGLVQSGASLERFGSAAKAKLGQICERVFRGDQGEHACRYMTLTPAGGPLSVITHTDTGRHLKPSMPIAPAGSAAGQVVDVAMLVGSVSEA